MQSVRDSAPWRHGDVGDQQIRLWWDGRNDVTCCACAPVCFVSVLLKSARLQVGLYFFLAVVDWWSGP